MFNPFLRESTAVVAGAELRQNTWLDLDPATGE